jgi:hypothetical protein
MAPLLWAVVRKDIMVKGHGRAELLTSSRERQSRAWNKIPFKDMPPVTYFLQRSPTS